MAPISSAIRFTAAVVRNEVTALDDQKQKECEELWTFGPEEE